ncbi:MAG: hypothetical protein KF706_10060 [Chitinophagales bacterium]|nr:hypothetical protein [Chitinophagales bacterium]OJV27550.1 MAG: hypothetical protein BGO32_02950 [Bacteroidetes bacterium 37-13]HRP39646.1 hypothetical protein [Chitinophagales bacterium]
MNQFMVEILLPTYMSDALFAYLPQQQRVVNKLFKQGIICSYSFALNRSKIWIVFNCACKSDVADFVEQFPIAAYTDYTISELAFSEQLDYAISTMSLN